MVSGLRSLTQQSVIHRFKWVGYSAFFQTRAVVIGNHRSGFFNSSLPRSIHSPSFSLIDILYWIADLNCLRAYIGGMRRFWTLGKSERRKLT
jgi:hypothetical protein